LLYIDTYFLTSFSIETGCLADRTGVVKVASCVGLAGSRPSFCLLWSGWQCK